MAGSEKVGTLVYDIEIDTAGLIEGQRRLQAELASLRGNLGGLNATINRTEQATRSAGSAMSSLSAVAKGLAAAITVHQITEYANAWVDVTNKLANSVRANEQVADVTQRVFDISQQTRSGLSATATLYGRLERATRTAGTSTADLVKLTTTINKGLAVSGATTEEASSTMTQLSQALASGVLRGEEFNSISENGSRLAVALADSLGVTIGQLRNMAAQGKLTTEVVVNGLLKQSDAIGNEFAKTALTMGQAFTVATNNITKFVGENTNVNTTLKVFNSTIITLSENLDTVSQVVGAAALIFGGRFVGALGASIAAQASQAKASMSQMIATRNRAQEELAAALVTQRKSDADKGAALSALNLATAEYNVAKGSAAEATALANVTRLRTAYIEAGIISAQTNNLVAASQARVAATGVTFANTMKAINLATAPLGGPLGVIAIVATGWYLYAQNQAQAKKESIAFADTLPDVISKLKEMNLAQAQGVRADTVTSIKNQKDEIADLQSHIADLNKQYNDRITIAKQMGDGDEENNGHLRVANELANDLAKANRDLDSKTRTLASSQDALRLVNIQVNQGIVDQMKAARDNAIAVKEAEKNASFLGQTHSFLAEKLGISTTALQKFNSESLKINWGGSEGEKLIKQAERRLTLAKLEGEEKARQQAAYDAEDAGTVDPLAIKRLQNMYAETERVTQGKKDSKKATREQEAADKKAANAQESVAQKLANLKQQSEQSAASTDDLSRAQAILTAQQSLGKSATQADIALAGQYAAKKWDVANALKAQAAAEKLIPEVKENTSYQQDVKDLQAALHGKTISQDQYNATSEQLEQQHQANLAKIRANQAAGVNPAQEAIGQIDPVQQLANQHAQQLALIQAFETQKGMLTAKGLALRDAENTAFEKKRTDAQWEILSQQSLGYEAMTAGFDAFSGSASNALTGLLTGTMSLSEAMSSLGNTVLNAVINSFVQAGAEWVKQLIIQQTLGSAVSAASAGEAALLATAWATPAALASLATAGGNAIPAQAGMTATVGMAQGMAVVGARKNGGPVSAGSLYEVGEGGMPEIYKASNGSQYMIPGNNGSVISNKDITGSNGGMNVQVVINNQVSNASPQYVGATQDNGSYILEFLISDAEKGGTYSNTLQSTFGLSRKATGGY